MTEKGNKRMMKFWMINGLLIALSSFTIFASDGVVVPQPQLMEKLGCGVAATESICFKQATKYSNPDAYIFEFKVDMDLDDNKVSEAVELSMEQVSTMLNPRTSKFYKFDSPLVELIDQSEYSASEIIILFKTYNKGKVYSSYFLPLTSDGETALYSGTFTGSISVYDLLKNRCNQESFDEVPYQYNGQTCLLKNR